MRSHTGPHWLNAESRPGSFYRAAVPQDVVNGEPDPSSWGEPVAALDPSGCDPIANFVNHSIVFGEYSIAPFISTLLTNRTLHRYNLLR